MVPIPADSSLSQLWRAPSVLWSMLGAQMLAFILALAPGLVLDRLVYLGLISLLLQWIVLLTLLLSRLFAGWLARLSAPQLAWYLVLLLGVSALLMCALVAMLVPSDWKLMHGSAIWLTLLQITLLVLIVGSLGALAFQEHWRSRQLALRAKQAELDVLRARVDPHFLFNSLNTATALLHTEPEDAERVLLDLADLFRAALTLRGEHPLRDEVELTRRYLEIERLRLDTRLQVEWQLPEPLPDVRIPSLVLQTLVENAVRHGVERIPAGGCVRIQGRLEAGGDLHLYVENPLPEACDASPGHNVGIAATSARIDAITDGRGALRVKREDGLFQAHIHLPGP